MKRRKAGRIARPFLLSGNRQHAERAKSDGLIVPSVVDTHLAPRARKRAEIKCGIGQEIGMSTIVNIYGIGECPATVAVRRPILQIFQQ
jgi:hypothetical protein